MDILLEALELITESEDFSRLYNDIRQGIVDTDVSVETGGGATEKWLAGMLASRGASDGKLNRAIQMLAAGQLDPETKEYRDAVRTKSAFEALYRARMVNQDDKGRYTFPSSRSQNSGPKLARLSAFRDFLSKGFNADKVKADTEKSFRVDKDAAVADMMDSFPPEQQRYAKMYSSLTVSAYNLLLNLYKKRGPKDVAKFRDTVNAAGFSESQDFALLRELGLVNDQNLLNRGELSKFGAFLQSTSVPQKMALNKELAQTAKSAQHTRQRTLNAAGKTGNGPEDEAIERDDTQLSGEMDDNENRAINSRIRDIEGGTKSSSKNDRAAGYKRTFSDVYKRPFN